MPYRINAIPTEIAEKVRATQKSPQYGHPAYTDTAQGYGPCRHCLHTFEVGVDQRILFTYDPFDGLETLPLPGPVYIHSNTCDRYPEDGGFPEDMRSHALTLNGYSRGRQLVEQHYVNDGDVEACLDKMLTRSAIDYIHVRDTDAGCYDFRVEAAE